MTEAEIESRIRVLENKVKLQERSITNGLSSDSSTLVLFTLIGVVTIFLIIKFM